MSRNYHAIMFAIKALAASVILTMTLLTTFALGPMIETRWFSPVSHLTVLSMEATPDGRTAMKVSFTKYRDCEYLGIAWYRGDHGGEFERVPIELRREPGDVSSPNRPVGTQIAGPWIISVPIEEIRTNSFAELSYHCNPFWVTRAEFYP